jgi:hypothetical protein
LASLSAPPKRVRLDCKRIDRRIASADTRFDTPRFAGSANPSFDVFNIGLDDEQAHDPAAPTPSFAHTMSADLNHNPAVL